MLILDRHNSTTSNWREVEGRRKGKRKKLLFDHKTIWLPRMFYYSSQHFEWDSTQQRWTTSTSTFSSSLSPASPQLWFCFPLHLVFRSLLLAVAAQRATLVCCSCFYERLVSPLHSLLWSLHVSIPIKSEIKWKLLCSYISSEFDTVETYRENGARKMKKISTIKILMSSRKDSKSQNQSRRSLLSRIIITSVLNISYIFTKFTSHSSAQIFINKKYRL